MSNSLEKLGIYNLGRISRDNDSILLYAPLSCNSVIITPDDLYRLEAAADGESQPEEFKEALETLANHAPVSRIHRVEDFVNLSLLPTNSCNFACSYCYSAKGRSSQTIDYAAIDKMIRYFVGLKRAGIPPLHVTIFGGGEPMLYWDTIVRPAIMLIEELRKDYCNKIHITLITNGSILPHDYIDICRRAHIDLAISFEILEELQNLQRRNYNTVYDNILTLCNKNLTPAINSVITDAAVEQMPLMVTKAIERIPGVRYLSFEPMTGEHTAEFYTKFTEKFFEAKALADSKGVNLTTSALRNVDVSVDRYCAGELALNAVGDITACPCISSPDQPGYRRWVYGRVTADGVTIDTPKLKSILSLDVNSQPWCEHCFARYNCGGGCLNSVIERGNKSDPNYCRFFKQFLRKIIIDRTL